MSTEAVDYWKVKINNSGITSEVTSKVKPVIMDTKSGLFVVVESGLSKNYLNMDGARNFLIEQITTPKPQTKIAETIL